MTNFILVFTYFTIFVLKINRRTAVASSSSSINFENKDIEISENKDKIRQSIWSLLEKKKLIMSYPPSRFGKIPNFSGNQFAAARVTELDEFKNAEVIKVNPSLAQMALRYQVMKSNKILIVPTPALTSYDGTEQNKDDPHFCYLLDGSTMSNWAKAQAKTKKGAIAIGDPLLEDWSACPHIDLVVVGSVAVSHSGRRLGKGQLNMHFNFQIK